MYWIKTSLIGLVFFAAPFTAFASLTTNLNAYWKYDESSGNASDATGNSNTFTNTSVTYSTGKINNAAYFNGTSAFLSAANSTSLNFTSDFSIGFWIYLNSSPGSAVAWPLFNKDGQFGVRYDRNKVVDGSKTSIDVILNGTGSAIGTEFAITPVTGDLLSTGVWHYVLFTYVASTGAFAFYVDGVSSTSGTNGALSITPTTNALVVGKNSMTYDNGTYFTFGWLDGRLDEAGIWARTLTSAEDTSLYNSGTGCQYAFSSLSSPQCIATFQSFITQIIALFGSW